MIRHTAEQSPEGILSAYSDNASVVEGAKTSVFIRNALTGEYAYVDEDAHILMKVETHNHPTAISPHPGAATGSGGEIRDEGATGRGSATKAGLTGFSVSHLRVPGFEQPWEDDNGKPGRLASALEIMSKAFFEQRKSGVNSRLKEALGANAKPYLISAVGKRPRTGYWIPLAVGQVHYQES